jgi:hypothetical protein
MLQKADKWKREGEPAKKRINGSGPAAYNPLTILAWKVPK